MLIDLLLIPEERFITVDDWVFTLEDQQALAEAFDRVEAEEMGAGVHERYHQLAHDLAR